MLVGIDPDRIGHDRERAALASCGAAASASLGRARTSIGDGLTEPRLGRRDVDAARRPAARLGSRARSASRISWCWATVRGAGALLGHAAPGPHPQGPARDGAEHRGEGRVARPGRDRAGGTRRRARSARPRRPRRASAAGTRRASRASRRRCARQPGPWRPARGSAGPRSARARTLPASARRRRRTLRAAAPGRRLVTYVPSPRRTSSTRAVTSARTASRTVFRDAPRRCARSASGGSRAPGSQLSPGDHLAHLRDRGFGERCSHGVPQQVASVDVAPKIPRVDRSQEYH